MRERWSHWFSAVVTVSAVEGGGKSEHRRRTRTDNLGS